MLLCGNPPPNSATSWPSTRPVVGPARRVGGGGSGTLGSKSSGVFANSERSLNFPAPTRHACTALAQSTVPFAVWRMRWTVNDALNAPVASVVVVP